MSGKVVSVTIVVALFVAAGMPLVGRADANTSKPVVVFDGWWTVDYARGRCRQAEVWNKENAALIAQNGCHHVTACREMMPVVNACRTDPASEVREYEANLEGEFAGNPACKGAQFVLFKGPGKGTRAVLRAYEKPHWSLAVDFEPGAVTQNWWLVRRGKHVTYLQGKGNPRTISEKVCTIVLQKGASVEN